MDSASSVAKNLLQIKAIKLSPQNPFTWASGIQSPIYCDNRISLSFPNVRDEISDCFISILKNHPECNVIAGVATAGIPHGAILAYRMGLPFVYVRDTQKSHGRQNRIEGELPPNSKVILIEDLISTGGSSIKAAQCLMEAGHKVIKIAAIFTYEFQLAKSNFEEVGLKVETITNYSTLLRVAMEENYFQSDLLGLLINWSKDPQNWKN